MKFKNTGENPNELHDYLISNDCKPISLRHDAIYSEDGIKTQEATEIHIEIEPEKEELLTDLVNQFMLQ